MVAVKSKGPTIPTYRMWHNHNATSQMLTLTVSKWCSAINQDNNTFMLGLHTKQMFTHMKYIFNMSL